VKRPFLCLYINDFLAHANVQALDDLGFAYYMRMLMRAWVSDEAYKLPNKEADLILAAGCKDIEAWATRRELIMRNWKESKDGKWVVNGRLKEEFQKAVTAHKKRQVAGSKGGKAKAMSSNATAMPQPSLATQTQTQTQTHKEQKQKANTSPVATLNFPSWLPEKEWGEFLRMRQRIRKPVTPYAMERIIKRLDGFRSRGQPPAEVLDQSTVNGWQNVYELKQDSRTHGQVTKAQRNEDSSRDAIKEALARRNPGLVAGEADGRDARALPESSTDRGHGTGLLDGLDGAVEEVRAEVIPAGARGSANGIRVLPIRHRDPQGD
jgi:uncharacterized protein YdaU (DUF1376 family)